MKKKLVFAITSIFVMSTIFTGCSASNSTPAVESVESAVVEEVTEVVVSTEVSESVQTEVSTEADVVTENESTEVNTEIESVPESEAIAIAAPEELTAENILQYNSDLLSSSAYKDVKLSVYSNDVVLTSYQLIEDADTKYHAWTLASVLMEEYVEGSKSIYRSYVIGSNTEAEWGDESYSLDVSMAVNTLKNFLESGVAEGTLSEDGTLTVTADGNTVLKDLGGVPIESKSINECVATFDKESNIIQKVTFSISGDKCIESVVLEVGGLSNTESISMPRVS